MPKRYKLFLILLSFVFMLVLAISLIFLWYVSRDQSGVSQPITEVKTDSYRPLQKFETDYFTFEADKSWSFVEKESTDSLFVYRSSVKDIVRRDLRVYVNSLPSNPLLTRVLTVEEAGDRFETGQVSEHCKEYLKNRIVPGNNNPIQAIIESVDIKCQIDGTSNTVGTGKKSGSYQTTLRANNRFNKYYLLYNDLEYEPKFHNFVNIARSFRAK
ncbi:MAG TPA: hypothetical protein VD947_04595 [Patescibacteria group bacterium]|nr:hypothetical protein [Patescibacteria group bacterium]